MITEDNGANWRRAYHETIEQNIKDLRLERASQAKRVLWIDDKRYAVMNLTDAQIELVARREAERAMNRAIIQRSEAIVRERARAGQAL